MSDSKLSSWVPVTSSENTSAKDLLKKALADHEKDSSKKVSMGSSSDPGCPPSQNIVDVLFKDFIAKKIVPSSESKPSTSNLDKKTGSSKSTALNDLLDLEIRSIRSSTTSSKFSDQRQMTSPVTESVNNLVSESFPTMNNSSNQNYDNAGVVIQNISTIPMMKNVEFKNNDKDPMSIPVVEAEQTINDTSQSVSEQVNKPGDTFLSMLPLPLAKKVAKPKLLDLKLTKESVSLLTEKEEDIGEEGEVFSSNSGDSDKNDSLSESDGCLPSDGGSLESDVGSKKSRSSKSKKKHKHKKKKKKKKSKSKDKCKDEKKNDIVTEKTSSLEDNIGQPAANDSLTEKNSREEKDDRKRKSDKSNSNTDRNTNVPEKKSKTEIKSSSSKDDVDEGKKKDRKKRRKSKSRSRSRSPRRGKHSRSRSRSPRRSKRSKSKSPRRSKRSKSKSPKRSKRSRSKSPRRSKRSRSKSPRRSRRSRSKSPSKSKHSRSRSKSPKKDKQSSSKSSTSRTGREDDNSRKSRSSHSERSRSKDRDSADLRVKIDKAKLRKIAIANALQNMKTGQGPEVSINTRAGGKSVEELTDFCKKISEKEKNESDVSESEEEPEIEQEEESLIHHPFKLRENSTNIVLNIRNAKQLPVLNPAEKQAQQASLRLTFPVSSGSHHRATESEWVPVEPKPTPPTSLERIQEYSKEKPDKPTTTKSIFPTQEEAKKIDIGSIISERLQAVRKLQENPYDVQALFKMHNVQEKAKKWASSKQLPGHFSGSTGANVMSQQEIIGDKRHQAWAKKTQLTQAAPVNGGIGMALLQKMGWKMGEGLGKNNEGSKVPLMLDVKVDRKGLKSSVENKKGGAIQTKAPRAKDLSNKHPVSGLMELCNRRRWGAPEFTVVSESGPDHQKNFLFKVKVNNVEYQPATASSNKKLAKAQCAAVCLQEMGLLPRDAPLNI